LTSFGNFSEFKAIPFDVKATELSVKNITAIIKNNVDKYLVHKEVEQLLDFLSVGLIQT
jgi:hypothetical protein